MDASEMIPVPELKVGDIVTVKSGPYKYGGYDAGGSKAIIVEENGDDITVRFITSKAGRPSHYSLTKDEVTLQKMLKVGDKVRFSKRPYHFHEEDQEGIIGTIKSIEYDYSVQVAFTNKEGRHCTYHMLQSELTFVPTEELKVGQLVTIKPISASEYYHSQNVSDYAHKRGMIVNFGVNVVAPDGTQVRKVEIQLPNGDMVLMLESELVEYTAHLLSLVLKEEEGTFAPNIWEEESSYTDKSSDLDEEEIQEVYREEEVEKEIEKTIPKAKREANFSFFF